MMVEFLTGYLLIKPCSDIFIYIKTFIKY